MLDEEDALAALERQGRPLLRDDDCGAALERQVEDSSAPCGSSCEVGSSSSRAGLERERRRQADALQLPGRKGLDAARREVLRADGGERRMCPREDLGRRRAEVLEPERHLVLDPVEDDLVLRVPGRAWQPFRRAQRATSRVSRPATSTWPAKRPPWKCGTRPESARRRVDFPEPEGPRRATTSPGSSSKRDALERGHAPVRIGEARPR